MRLCLHCSPLLWPYHHHHCSSPECVLRLVSISTLHARTFFSGRHYRKQDCKLDRFYMSRTLKKCQGSFCRGSYQTVRHTSMNNAVCDVSSGIDLDRRMAFSKFMNLTPNTWNLNKIFCRPHWQKTFPSPASPWRMKNSTDTNWNAKRSGPKWRALLQMDFYGFISQTNNTLNNQLRLEYQLVGGTWGTLSGCFSHTFHNYLVF